MSEYKIKNIKGYEEYYTIDNLGKIYSKRKNKYIKPGIKSNGYINVVLTNDTTHKTYYIHILVAQHFIDNPNNLPKVNHKNGIKSDVYEDNLEWITHKNNIIHSYDVLGRIPYNNDHMKKPIGKYDKKGKLLTKYESLTEAAEINNIAVSNLSMVLNKITVKCNKRGKVYYHVNKTVGGYYWKFL